MAASGPAGYDDEGGVITDINVTPLVDVTLVLLIIMMVTAPMLVEPTAIKVNLPKGKTGEVNDSRPGTRTLVIGKAGQVQFEGASVTVEELKEKLAKELSLTPDLQVAIAADQEAEYGQVIQVLDTIRTAGVSRFSLQMESDLSGPLPSPGPPIVKEDAPPSAGAY